MLASGMHPLICLVSAILLVGIEDFASGQIHFKKGAPHVKLANNGLLSGKVFFSRDGRPFNGFIGIPYATIPERFAEAKLITEPSWEGVKSSVTPGPMCTQAAFVFNRSDGVPTMGEEDCLNLNVYIPMNNTGKRGYPVMVWVHGGGFMFGGGYGYGPKYFMDEDVIIVSINYRLGVYGFLSTSDSTIPGNNGLKDAVVALRWVQENIKKFGGDPQKVTIFGESAGSGVVHNLLLSPTTKGLIHRAISQSGSAVGTWAYHPNPKETAIQLATHMKCQTSAANPSEISSEEILACLRKATNQELNEAQFSFKDSWPMNIKPFHFGPTKEPESSEGSAFLTESSYAMLTNRMLPLAEVPWMVGVNEDEGACMFAGMVFKDKDLIEELDTNWNEVAIKAFDLERLAPKNELATVAEKLRQFYFGSSPVSTEVRDSLTNLYSDQLMVYGVYKSAVETAARGKRNLVYLYQYAHPSPISMMGMTLSCAEEEQKKIGHADEVAFQFDFGEMMPGFGEEMMKVDPVHEEFSKNFVKLWTSFAIHGEPKHSWGNSAARKWKAVSWKEVSGERPLRWYRIEANPGQIEDPYTERMAFWEQLHKDHFEQVLLPPSARQGTANKAEL